jgi:hypothetical protein
LQEELGDVSIQCRIFGFKFEKLFPHSLQLWINLDSTSLFYRGRGGGGVADKSLAWTGRKQLTGQLQTRRNWPTWVSIVLITHPILWIWPRWTTTCSLDWKNNWKGSRSGLGLVSAPVQP